MQPTPPTVFIVDDDPGIRRSTAMLLASANLPCVQFAAAAEFLDAYQPGQPGCLILDLHMPGMGGLELVEQLRARQVLLPVLIVSGTGTIPTAVQGMKLGVLDFLVKPADPDLLLGKVQAALELDGHRRTDAAALDAIRARLAKLTGRETETLRLLVVGLANKEVAAQLGISIKTVENHRARIMLKTGALNVADLTRMSMLVNDMPRPR
jgi:two-component system response regulator FixJ